MIKYVALSTLTALLTSVGYSYGPSNGGKPSSGSTNGIKTKAANCSPSTGRQYLEIVNEKGLKVPFNNVRTIVETSGFAWLDRSTGQPAYEVPAGGGRNTIYAGALWLGGTTTGGILKVAAHLYHQNNDFWAGPLTSNQPGDGINTIGYGEGQIDPPTCNLYDRMWITSRQEVLIHYFCKGLDECPEDYEGIPESIRTWPGNYIDDGSKYVDYFLAPFVDVDGDQIYDPEKGDYPGYDLFKANDCPRPRGGRVDLFGDYNAWYVFNDRGNVHTETGGQDIGMEIKSQAFAFNTADEVNNMTFYNYELINRSTTTLINTYFGQYADTDIGCSGDDYSGCDVQRGFGYAYNATAVDGADCFGAVPYNDGTPPAIGIDFFEGPYQDNDGVDNPLTSNVAQAIEEKGIPYSGLGLGYSDGVIDNERMGMSRFVFFNRSGTAPIAALNDPSNAIEYYNYMRGVWRDGTEFLFGGLGHTQLGGTIPTKYVFPGDSDPLFWGTSGVPVPQDWTEANENNQPGDRRFFQSAGPFTLEPGALNNITVGVVYARAASGDPFQSVQLVRLADDKAQALFDNCFRLIDGPDAPDVAGRELDRELILYISNSNLSNNAGEKYIEKDPNLTLDITKIYLDTVDPADDPAGTGADIGGDGICPTCYYKDDNFFRFQGYQVFQLVDASVGADELDNVSKARLVAQCDFKDGVSRLVNFEFDEFLSAAVPIEKVNGNDNGISHTFRFTTDAFAQGDVRLVNYKKYHFMVVAYAFNNFRDYKQSDPLFLDGQKQPYLRGRKGARGAIEVVTLIPHKPIAGSVLNSQYGSTPIIIREEGRGNGGLEVDFTEETENEIVNNFFSRTPSYKQNFVPIDLKIIDPLKVPNDNFELRFFPSTTALGVDERMLRSKWALISKTSKDTVWSDTTISFRNEQILLNSKASKFNSNQFVDIDWGFSISITQPSTTSGNLLLTDDFPYLLSATLTYTDSTKPWLSGVRDSDGSQAYNWIRSGTTDDGGAPSCTNSSDTDKDPDEIFENVLNGTWAPFGTVAAGNCFGYPLGENQASFRDDSNISSITSVDIVFTSDKSKWTRSPVLEMQNDQSLSKDNVSKLSIRKKPSVNKEGTPDNTGTTGLGWFPGYAIDINTGERLNIAFGEDTWDAGHNGDDMIWNPTSNIEYYGGKHYIYVFRNNSYENLANRMTAYDGGNILPSLLQTNPTAAWNSCIWVGAPLLAQGQQFLATDARIRIRVSSPYKRFSNDKQNGHLLTNLANSKNSWFPLYSFNTADLAHEDFNLDSAQSALDRINIVPNPYYAYSEYEERRLETRVRLINLPETCTIRIYNTGGTLVRTFKKDSEITYLDWDLNNHQLVPIASGMYIIHVDVPGIGEKVIKWLGIMRTPDLEKS
jgi:hypothetical protein